MSFPTPGVFYSTGGVASFIPDVNEPANDPVLACANEPYLDVGSCTPGCVHIPTTFALSGRNSCSMRRPHPRPSLFPMVTTNSESIHL